MDGLGFSFPDKWQLGRNRDQSERQESTARPPAGNLRLEPIGRSTRVEGPRDRWQLFTGGVTSPRPQRSATPEEARHSMTIHGTHSLRPSVQLRVDAAGTADKLDGVDVTLRKHFRAASRGRPLEGQLALHAASDMRQVAQLAAQAHIT